MTQQQSTKFKWRDRVVVVSGKHRGQELMISSIHESGIWLIKPPGKRDDFALALGPFTPEQLQKAE